MSVSAQWHDRLDRLRSRCDRALDTATGLPMFALDILRHAIEIEGLAAGAVFELYSPVDAEILTAEGLSKIAADGVFTLDPDHVSLLRDCINQKKTHVETDRSVPEAGLRQHTAIMAPVPGNQPPVRVVELVALQKPNSEHLTHLREVVEMLVSYIQQFQQEGARPETPPDDGSFWENFDEFLLRLQRSLHVKETVAVAVNDGRKLVGCDRMSIALWHGGRAKVFGVSGQEDVAQRAVLVRSMSRLCRAVMKGGQPVTYRGTVEDLAPQLEQPLADYLSASRTRMVMLLPLRQPVPLIVDEPETNARRKEKPRKVLGCLVVEQATEARPKPHVIERTELLTEHVETAIHNAQRYESIFLLPLWRGLGRTFSWFKGRRLWTALAVVAALIGVGFGLAYIPWDYRVEAKGQAMPTIQHEVFAPWDGDVQQVFVTSGQPVQPGDKLVQLQNDDLDAELIEVGNELDTLAREIEALTVRIKDAQRRGDREDEVRAAAEQARAQVSVVGANDRQQKLLARREKLLVRSPATGVVATFQVEQLLLNRPVRRGERLLEIMDDTGPWRLELEIPEYRMGHVQRALSAAPAPTLPVEYVLATAVETSYQGELNKIANRSNQSQEEGTIVEVFADINVDDLPARNIGADVTAKINCGKNSLFYVLFGDVVEFVLRYFWL